MDSRDPPPFGYTFDTEFLGAEPAAYANGNHPLLNEHENQSLLDFFNQDPFLPEPTPFAQHPEGKSGLDDFNWDFVPPPNVHQVSTTIPDQAQLHHGFHNHHPFTTDPLSASQLTNTQDDLQAASTLFNNAQASHANGRSYSVPSVPTMHGLPASSSEPTNSFHNLPLVPTPHGLMNEQLAAVLPNHSQNGTIDAQIAAQFTQLQPQHTRSTQLERQPPQLKRSYTYGTDSNFHDAGYVPPSPNAEEAITQRLLHDMRATQQLMSNPMDADDRKPASPTGQLNFPVGIIELPSDGEAPSEEDTSDDEDGDRPAKKRRKAKTSTSIKAEKGLATQRKSIAAARPGKNRKASVDEQAAKKKRLSSAGQKAQRENLSEEQKRNNHILSEQKRRNLIKRGFDDLHDLVPEIRNGGLSKSSVLMEAAAFLEKIIEDNIRFKELSASADG